MQVSVSGPSLLIQNSFREPFDKVILVTFLKIIQCRIKASLSFENIIMIVI